EHNGRLVRQNPDHFLVSFDSVTRAVLCTLEIQNKFERSAEEKIKAQIKLNIGLQCGVPVDEKEGFFENTIKAAQSYYDLVNGTVVLSAEVKDLYESENINTSLTKSPVMVLDPSEEKFLKDLVDFTGREWKNASLYIDDFCRILGYSKSSFYRKLIAVTGKSPNAFLKEYRLQRAVGLLNIKELNISEIAFETGFNSPAYFSKCFREIFGVLPSVYIKSIR